MCAAPAAGRASAASAAAAAAALSRALCDGRAVPPHHGTPWYCSGAMLANLVNTAATMAGQAGREQILYEDLLKVGPSPADRWA